MWAQIINAILGIWLMAAPAVLDYGDPGNANDRIVGPLVTSCALIAISQVTRPLRWANVAFGLWLLMAPLVLRYGSFAAVLNSLAVGLGLIAFSLVRGQINDKFGGGWSSLWRANSEGGSD